MNTKRTLLSAASSLAFALTVGSAWAQDLVDTNSDEIGANFGDVDAFFGDIDAFFGDIDAFWGDIDAFFGDIDAFWGDIDAFTGDIDAFTGDIDAFWGDIDAFFGDIDAFWGDIDAFNATDPEFQNAADALKGLFDSAEQRFADDFANFDLSVRDDFLDPLLAEYGVDFDDPESLKALNENELKRLFIDIYDGLALRSGRDMVDHWMPAIRWSPAISQAANGGAGVTVGLLDTPITSDTLIGGAVQSTRGHRVDNMDHGNAVASLLASAHDGYGVMGVAPAVDFRVYNPFDESFSASWHDVAFGVGSLALENASVINMSLGLPGYTLHQDWVVMMNNPLTQIFAHDVVFVKAAGNSGVTQTQDVEWGLLDGHERLLIVGSVGSDNTISAFSNRPGEACLLTFGTCHEEDRLKNRFLVAPGERVLVQTGDGNVTRASGTSLAAPLVSGAVALLQSRWNWLQQHPDESSDIILFTATDLGDPGIDGTYGWGLLNVEASQQPLNAEDLYVTIDGQRTLISTSGLSASLLGLTSDSATLTAYEDIGNTYRDFEIDVSALSIDYATPEAAEQNIAEEALATSVQQMSGWSSWRDRWKKYRNRRGLRGVDQASSFNDHNPYSTQMFGAPGTAWQLSLNASPRDPMDVTAADAVSFTTSATLENANTGLRVSAGRGRAALAMAQRNGFGRSTDTTLHTGGVNPYLGFASGGSFVSANIPVTEGLSVTFNWTENDDEHLYRDQFSGELLEQFENREDYAASALVLGVDYRMNDHVRVGLGYTIVDEASGLFSGQGTGALNLNDGTRTNAVTVDLTAILSESVTLATSATMAQTDGNGSSDSLLGLSQNGLTSTAWQVALEKQGLVHRLDRARLSVAQPLHVLNGSLILNDTQVVDRETGALGAVSEAIDLGGNGPRYVTEMLYGRPVIRGKADLAAFGQVMTRGLTSSSAPPVIAGGVRFTVDF